MPIFKVTIKEETTQTYVAYVNAPSVEDADKWASMIEDVGGVGICIGEDSSWGSIENIEEVNSIPFGYRVGTII
jgi:hypothetical protein